MSLSLLLIDGQSNFLLEVLGYIGCCLSTFWMLWVNVKKNWRTVFFVNVLVCNFLILIYISIFRNEFLSSDISYQRYPPTVQSQYFMVIVVWVHCVIFAGLLDRFPDFQAYIAIIQNTSFTWNIYIYICTMMFMSCMNYHKATVVITDRTHCPLFSW